MLRQWRQVGEVCQCLEVLTGVLDLRVITWRTVGSSWIDESEVRPIAQGLLGHGGVGIVDRLVPLGFQLRDRHLEHGFQRLLRVAGLAGDLECLADGFVSPLPGHERPEGLTPAVREVLPLPGRQVTQRRETTVAGRGIPHPHGRVGIDRADRQVFGHPLDEPQRKQERRRAAKTDTALARQACDVKLERVNELVPDHVIRLVEGAREWKHDASLQDLRHTARGLADLPEHRVGLLEIGMAGVQDQGLSTLELVVQQTAQASIPALRHAARLPDDVFHLGVVVNVEMLGLQDLGIESLVLDLVATEVLRRRGIRQDGRPQQERQKEEQCPRNERATCHVVPPWSEGVAPPEKIPPLTCGSYQYPPRPIVFLPGGRLERRVQSQGRTMPS